MSPRRKIKADKEEPKPCRLCVHAINPRNLSVTGIPTLATCPFEEFAILYQRECVNGHYKQKIE